jgi:hypothetical protein
LAESSLFDSRVRWARCVRLGLTFAINAAVGCTEFAPGSDTPETVGSQRGSLQPVPNGEDWSCLNRPVQPSSAPVFAGAAPRVIYSMQMVDLSSGAIYRSIQVRACSLTDVTCANPLTGSLSVNEQGTVDIPLFQNFTGYLEITGSDIVPQIFYLNEPLQLQTKPEWPLAMVALASLPPLVQLLGVELQPTAGLIALRVFDCQAHPAAGVSLSTEARAALPWYFVDGLPSGTESQTGSEGLAGFVNVPPGLAVFEAATRGGEMLGGRQSLVVRPGWMSSMYLRPRGVQTSAP